MKITIERELDVEELFDCIVSNFADYTACVDVDLYDDDITPGLLADIFSELAKVAAERAQ